MLKKLDIRQKLSLRITFFVGTIILLCAVSVYMFSKFYLETKFYNRLQERAITAATIFLDNSSNTKDILETSEVSAFADEAISIYDANKESIVFSTQYSKVQYHLSFLYEDNIPKHDNLIEDADYKILLKQIKNLRVIISAKDIQEKETLTSLLEILIIVSITAIVLVCFMSWLLAHRFLSPILSIREQLKDIFPNNISKRINYNNKDDELGYLTDTMNELLSKVEKSFQAQRLFVSNFSHELKNPLTRIFTQIEILAMEFEENESYNTALLSLRKDILQVNGIVDSLLELESIQGGNMLLNRKIQRVDEILFEVAEDYLKWNPSVKININFDGFPSEEEKLLYKVNKKTLKIVFKNLIDNGIKFSNDNQVKISLYEENEELRITFFNQGDSIPLDKVNDILKPFYRLNSTATGKKGHGVGLALVNEIVEMHEMLLDVQPQVGGNIFSLKFFKSL